MAFQGCQKWEVWRLLPGWQSVRRDLAWAESVVLRLMAQTVVEEHGPNRVIVAFISAMAGSLAGSMINNYINRIRTWHIIHCIMWSIDYLAIEMVMCAATVSAPSKSSKPPRQPVTITYLTAILSHLNKDDPLDAVVAACITTMFWLVSQLGKFTVKTLRSQEKHYCQQNQPRP